ncbi:hypothetical protein RCG19_19090 [Neobacillus sp. OS1-2]|nr:hypothetical protein [Neobacillus sp. OS1-2]WML39267.1 hypothetical protein RCG19_19090 [Neobacillus sp. OS1-2]
MDKKKLMMTTIGIGAAYLLRSGKSRKKLMNQFNAMAGKSKR